VRTERFRGALLSTLVIASLITPLLLLSSSPVHAALTPHAPISINNDAGFTSPDPVNGGGSGTENDPYIIENWDISAGSAIGIEIWNTTAHFIIRNCYVHDGVTYGAGIISLYWVTNGMLDNVLVENSYYQGIHLYNSSNNTISNSTVENTQEQCGIFLYDSDNNLIENNTCMNNKIDGIYTRDSHNNRISNNTCENNEGGIGLWNSDKHLILNNTTMGNNGNGIALSYSDNNTLDNNTCENNEGGIQLWNSDNNTISNNIAGSSGVWDGIYLEYSNNNLISNNTCSNNPYHGICLDFSDNNIISNNYTEGNSLDGIDIYSSNPHNNLISNNFMVGNGRNGIYLYLIENSTIDNNIAKNNSMSGIFLSRTSNNLISNNLAVRNRTGIYTQNYSDNNRIFHNNLVNNTDQAHDECSNNWDNGYPSGGNYWNDYTGADNYQGENQDIAGSDGIGDTPYYIPAGSNQDRYPIMSPFPFRDVGVEILPIYREGPAKATLTYIVTVTNLGTENDNYDLTLSDDAGWGPTLSDNLLEIPAGENGQMTLSVTIPENALPFVEDTMMVTVTSQADNRVKDVGSCKARSISPKADFSFVTLYEVRLDLNLYLENGSKLVVKFYTYADAFENENVIENFSTPWHVEENEIVPHPQGEPVKKVRLDLTADNTEEMISTIASFTVTRDDLFGRIMVIKGLWPISSPIERDALFSEIMDIKGQWPIAPS